LAMLSPMTVMELPNVVRPLMPENSELESPILFTSFVFRYSLMVIR